MNEQKDLVLAMQKIEYQILCDVDDFCKKSGITYYLSGGSCLGAVRHHGFIPWDDDADIMLPRKDYEQFLPKFAKAYEGKYKVGSIRLDKEWVRPACRIWDISTHSEQFYRDEMPMGVSIDVFPIDALPNNTVKRFFFHRKIQFYGCLWKAAIRKKNGYFRSHRIAKEAFVRIVKPFHLNVRKIAEKADAYASKYEWNSSKYVAAVLAIHYWDKETIERKYIDHPVYLTFGERKFPVPNGYDKYLKNLYGDYMKIPKNFADAEKGSSHLDFWDVKLGNDDQEKKNKGE